MKRKILVVDDDRKAVELLSLYLERDGYHVLSAFDGQQALDVCRSRKPDLIVLDVMLPKVDGLDVCRILRVESRVPIIMLTARVAEDDKLLGLELGADDYVTKPFSPRELVARVRAVLRRVDAAQPTRPPVARFGDLTVDYLRHEARIHGELVHLTPTEFKLLGTLAAEPGRAFSRLQLLEEVLGYDYEGLERTLDVHVMNLRKKIEPDPVRPAYIRTVYGVGYKMAEHGDVA